MVSLVFWWCNGEMLLWRKQKLISSLVLWVIHLRLEGRPAAAHKSVSTPKHGSVQWEGRNVPALYVASVLAPGSGCAAPPRVASCYPALRAESQTEPLASAYSRHRDIRSHLIDTQPTAWGVRLLGSRSVQQILLHTTGQRYPQRLAPLFNFGLLELVRHHVGQLLGQLRRLLTQMQASSLGRHQRK